MTAFVMFLLVCLILAASVTGIVVFGGKVQGLRLLVVAPVPAALAVGLFMAAYFLTYTTNYHTVLFFAVGFAIGAWVIGFLFSAVLVAVRYTFHPRTKDSSENN